MLVRSLKYSGGGFVSRLGAWNNRSFSVEVDDRIKNVKESATLKINMKVKAMREKDPNLSLTHFGFGQSPFPVPAPIEQALKDHAHEKDYLPTRGHPRLCGAIANYYKKYHNLSHFNEENVFVGPGSKELIYHLLYLLKGDLLLPSPSWVSYAPQAHLVGKTVRGVEGKGEEGFRITGETLERACQEGETDSQKILILNSPNNPTGAVYPPQELEKIAKICEKYNIVPISDEIYANINFSENHHVSLAEFCPSRTIVTGGLSKLFGAGGYRFGCALIPGKGFGKEGGEIKGGEFGELWEGLRVVISETYSCVSAPIQWAAIKAYEDYDEITPYLEKCNKIHELSSLYLHQRFEKMGLFCPRPGGAFYLFPCFTPFEEKLKMNGVNNSEQLANFLLENAHVASLPSSEFNLPPSHLSLRIATVDYDGGKIVKHLEEGGEVELCEEDVGRWMPRLKEGCDRLEKLLGSL